MKNKFIILGIASLLLFLGCFIGLKTQAKNIDLSLVSSSCDFNNLSTCSRDDLIILLLHLILGRTEQASTELPDLVVHDIFYDSNGINAEYCNIGNSRGVGNFSMKFRNEDTGKEVVSSTNLFRIPQPKECGLWTISCSSLGLSSGEKARVSVEIDWENKISESNKANNRLEKVLPSLNATAQRVISPVSGSTFFIGDSIDIIWKGEKNTLYIASVETIDKSQNWTLAFSETMTNEHGIGIHTWQRVAENFADGNQYRIYVQPQTSTNTRDIISVENITFSKQVTGEPELSITFPTENDILVIGETYTITWNSKNLKGDSISVLGNNETSIATLPITATSYKWTVPETCKRGEQSEITIISKIGTNWEKVAKTKFIASNYPQGDIRYPAAEIIEDNLPTDLTFWVPASCPSIPSIMNYEVPEGYELIFCETGVSGYYGDRFYNVISKVKIRAKTAKFNATEIVEDNLPYNITFWTEAHCPSSVGYEYKIPEGYELVSCEGGNIGSHGGCVSCPMSKIKLKSKVEYAKFNATEIVEDNLPFSITLWAEQYCPGSDTTIGYEAPEGYKVVSCEGGERGSHGGCTFCPMSKFKLEKINTDN